MVRQKIGRHPLLIALAMFAAVVSARPAAAQDGRMQGVVTDAARMPVAGAKVTIELKDSGRKFTAMTDAKGEYIQVGLVAGMYVVTVEKDALSATRTVMLRGGTANRQNFVLAAAGPGGAAAPSPAAAEMQKVFTEGLELSKAGNHDEAIAKFTRATELNPKCADCFYNIGYSHAQKKDYDKAEEAFKKAIEIKADYADAYNGLATIYNAQRKFDLASAASTKANELASAAPGGAGGSPDAMFNQGVILWNAGKIAEAKKQFEATIAAKPDHAEAHYQLAMALVNEGDLKGAGAQFETYLKLAPNGPNAATAKALAAQLPK